MFCCQNGSPAFAVPLVTGAEQEVPKPETVTVSKHNSVLTVRRDLYNVPANILYCALRRVTYDTTAGRPHRVTLKSMQRLPRSHTDLYTYEQEHGSGVPSFVSHCNDYSRMSTQATKFFDRQPTRDEERRNANVLFYRVDGSPGSRRRNSIGSRM